MLHSFDVVVANMLAPALVRLAPSITSAVKEDVEVNGVGGGGILALSGMRREQVPTRPKLLMLPCDFCGLVSAI